MPARPILAPSGAVNLPVVSGLINDARNGICHAPLTGGSIALQNGNPLNPISKAINDWLAANGGPITVTIPIIQTGPGGGCSVKFNQALPVAGFARIQIVKVWPPGGQNGNTIDIVVLCNQSQDSVGRRRLLRRPRQPRLPHAIARAASTRESTASEASRPPCETAPMSDTATNDADPDAFGS